MYFTLFCEIIWILILVKYVINLVRFRKWFELNHELLSLESKRTGVYSQRISPPYISMDGYIFPEIIRVGDRTTPEFGVLSFLKRALPIIIMSPIAIMMMPLFIAIGLGLDGYKVFRDLKRMVSDIIDEHQSLTSESQILSNKINIINESLFTKQKFMDSISIRNKLSEI